MGVIRHPLLYEINTRCWLRELSRHAGKRLTLADIPEFQFRRWREWGFTHIWLMGVWSTGSQARNHALRDPGLLRRYSELLPDWHPEDVGGSPYAIGDYQVSPLLGNDRALATFRGTLHRFGMKLILDFVPNHVARDHPWITRHPERFVLSRQKTDGTFAATVKGKAKWIAHGRDPYFAPWSDTAQLDYRRAETRTAMTEQLQSVAERCDGVRCDMAMLVLKEVFAKTWANFPADESGQEFWRPAIAAIKAQHPDFIFLAEVYWGLEERLQRQGFHYTYDKEWYDQIIRFEAPELYRRLREKSPAWQRRTVRFLENHDEKRIAAHLRPDQHRAAATLLLSMPGMRLLHEGQLEGRREHIPVQLARRAQTPADPQVSSMYDRLFKLLATTSIGTGRWQPLKWEPDPAKKAPDVLANSWQARGQIFHIAVINWSDQQRRGWLKTEASEVIDLFDNLPLTGVPGSRGIPLDLPPFAARLLRCKS